MTTWSLVSNNKVSLTYSSGYHVDLREIFILNKFFLEDLWWTQRWVPDLGLPQLVILGVAEKSTKTLMINIKH